MNQQIHRLIDQIADEARTTFGTDAEVHVTHENGEILVYVTESPQKQRVRKAAEVYDPSAFKKLGEDPVGELRLVVRDSAGNVRPLKDVVDDGWGMHSRPRTAMSRRHRHRFRGDTGGYTVEQGPDHDSGSYHADEWTTATKDDGDEKPEPQTEKGYVPFTIGRNYAEGDHDLEAVESRVNPNRVVWECQNCKLRGADSGVFEGEPCEP